MVRNGCGSEQHPRHERFISSGWSRTTAGRAGPVGTSAPNESPRVRTVWI